MTQWAFDEERQAGQLRIDGPVTIAQVAELKELLMQAVEQAQTVVVELSRVDQVDIAGMQLFCAAHRLACGCGKELKLSGGGERFRALAGTAGLDRGSWCSIREKTPCLWTELA